MLILFLTIFPFTILGIILSKTKKEIIRISLIGSIINLIEILLILENYDNNISNYQFKFYNIIGIDGLSIWLIILVSILIPIILLNISYNKINKMKIILLILIGYFSILIFSLLDLILFYICYEILLIPMYYLIGYYGTRNRKILALFEFYIYTLIGSLLLLIVILIFFFELGQSNFEYLYLNQFSLSKQIFLFLFLFIGFGLKIPILPLHLWLPEAHVEAPTSISIYLAAIILKLGSYGIIRFNIGLLPLVLNTKIIILILTIGILGLILTSIACLTLWDIKKVIAYSSIGHMNLAILGIFSNNIYGLNGSIYFLISHGIISSGLFILIGFIYDRYHTRIFKYFKGLILFLPLLSLFFFFFTLANLAFPLTSGYFSEILTFIGIFIKNPILGLLGTLAIILTPIYSLWYFHKLFFGSLSNYITPSLDISRKEINIILPLLILSLFIGIYPNIILNSIEIISYKYII